MVNKPNFEPVPHWCQIPHGISFANDATSVAVDSQDNVYVFNRGPDPIIIFDKKGNFQDKWGKGEFVRPHGIYIDFEDNLYLVDDDGHFIDKRTKEGKLIFRLGEINKPAPWQSGGMFNRPTDAVVNSKTGDIFISDGYGNSRVHKFDNNGKHILSWGESGSDDGKFSLPHNITLINNEKIVVADRENFRLQVFSLEGEYLEQWHVHHPMSVRIGPDNNIYVGEMGPPPVQEGVKNLGNCILVLSNEGEKITRFGDELPGSEPQQFVAPHGIAIDSDNSVYVAEVAWTYWYSRQEKPPLGEIPSIRKWIKK